MEKEKRTITIAELQDSLGISRATAYRLVNSEGFPTVRIGRKVLISTDGLTEWLSKGGVKHIEAC